MSEVGYNDPNNPWVALPDALGGQSGRVKAYCQIWVAGVDVTNRLNPYLLSVEVHDGFAQEEGFSCIIELDDRSGQLPIPPFGAPVAAGVTDHVWSIVDIVSITEAAEPVPAKRGPYKKRSA